MKSSILEEPKAELLSFEEYLDSYGFLIYTNIGSSMLPLLRHRRDIIEICKKSHDHRCKRYDVVLYKVCNKYILHRVLRVRPNDYVICGDHNFSREYGITDKQILGVMTRVIRNGKNIYPTDIKYKLYVHVWCDFYPVRAAILYLSLKTKIVWRRAQKLLFGQNKETNE